MEVIKIVWGIRRKWKKSASRVCRWFPKDGTDKYFQGKCERSYGHAKWLESPIKRAYYDGHNYTHLLTKKLNRFHD